MSLLSAFLLILELPWIALLFYRSVLVLDLRKQRQSHVVHEFGRSNPNLVTKGICYFLEILNKILY